MNAARRVTGAMAISARDGTLRGVTVLGHARDELAGNVRALTLDEALFAAGGYRSVLGVLKHLAAWTHVYWSYAFEAEPRHFAETSWPRGLRDTVVRTDAYVREIVAWADDGLARWEKSLDGADLARDCALHWGATLPFGDVVVLVAHHVAYHTGEVNMLLSIARGEAWEETEEVEENHISTAGHRVRPPWLG